MTLQEVKSKLIDKIGDELIKDNIPSEAFVHYAEAITILIDYEDADEDNWLNHFFNDDRK